MEHIRLILIDDHVLFRESLGRLFASEQDLEVVGQCSTIAEALDILQHSQVDLMLLDFNLGKERGTDLIAAVQQAGYAGRILMVTAVMDAAEVLKALQYGTSGVFLKHSPPGALIQAIHMVAGGEVWLDRGIVQLLAERVPLPANEAFGMPLTDREEQVLHGVLEGSTNRKIAEELGGSEGSVKAAIQQLFRKSGVRTRSQLVRAALEGHIQTRQK
ncbi:MAG: response regulator transcription factor [Candidatus Sulfopaludibacter sp.]|nr:response regulator transcription factor [Candidatus Sulfopaludibacter sp.]